MDPILHIGFREPMKRQAACVTLHCFSIPPLTMRNKKKDNYRSKKLDSVERSYAHSEYFISIFLFLHSRIIDHWTRFGRGIGTGGLEFASRRAGYTNSGHD